MEVKCVLGVFDQPAMNEEGNTLTEQAFMEYFKSNMWMNQRDSHKILGGITHLLRNDAGSEEGMGSSDELLKNGVITHYLKDAWISQDHKRVEGIIEVFDDLSLYSEDQKSDILQLLRLLKNGVHVGLSLVIYGDWDDQDGHLIHIYSIAGVDVTLDPSFVTTETIEVL